MLKSGITIIFLALICFFAACKSDSPYDEEAQAAIDDEIIKTFLDSTNTTAQKTSTGLYYQVIKEGTGTRGIDLLDTAYIHYVGTILKTRVVFDSTATLSDSLASKFVLQNAIPAWIEGLRMIPPGGRIRLFVPSRLAYRNFGVGTLPTPTIPNTKYIYPNTVLEFDLRLYKIEKPKTQVTTN